MRDLYGKGFYLISIYSTEEERLDFLKTNCHIHDNDNAKDLIIRDRSSDKKYGQNIDNTFHLADFFIHDVGDIKKQITSYQDFLMLSLVIHMLPLHFKNI